MNTFTDLGLHERVAAAARAAGYERPTPLQSSSIPVLRRGGNVLLHASSGAGVVAAFGLPLLDRLGFGDEAGTDGLPRALVLAPTADRVGAVADGLATLAGDTGVAVRATGAGWRLDGADVLVTTTAAALHAVQESALKLEHVQSLVVVDAAELFALGQGETLETLVALVPREAQRIVATPEVNSAVEHFVEAHARRALTVPSRPADRAAGREPEPIGQIGYLVVQEDAKPEMTARLLEGVEEAVLVHTRTAARAERVLAELSRRGAAAASVQVLPFERAGEHEATRIISYDVPFSADELRAIHATGGTVLVTPVELRHLQRIAGEVPFTLKHRRARAVRRDALDEFRDAIGAAVAAEDLDAQLLILEPLFAEHPAEHVAAALSALLRRRRPPAATPTADAVTGAPPASAAPGTFTRLFVSIGARDNVRPGDLVGAITGEAGIKGEQVGRVDIRDTFSVVEVAASAAEKVIRALNGTTMRGRSLRVDFDRKTGGGEDRPRGTRPPRDGPGRGPGRAGPGRGAGPGRRRSEG